MNFIRRSVIALSILFALASVRAQTAVESWVRRYGGSIAGNGQALAIVTDEEGNAYVGGSGTRGGGYSASDYLVIKYSAFGSALWTNRYEGSVASYEGAIAMTREAMGNVVVFCNVAITPGIYDYATIACSSNGVGLWTNRLGAGAGQLDRTMASGIGIASDKSNHVFVTAICMNAATNADVTTVAYGSDGAAIWTNRYGGPNNAIDAPSAIAVNSQGEILVCGFSQFLPSGEAESFIISYSNSGMPLWTNRFRDSLKTLARDMTVDDEDRIFVVGQNWADSGGENATCSFSREGVRMWTNAFAGPVLDGVKAMGIATDHSGKVFVTARGDNSTWWTVGYSAAGQPLWTNIFTKRSLTGSMPQSLVADAGGNVIVAGIIDTQAVTVAYSNLGTPLWTNSYSGPGVGVYQPRALATGPRGSVFVAGGSITEFVTIKYSPIVPLSLSRLGDRDQVVLTWTNSAFGWTNLDFGLQAAVESGGTFTNVIGATSPYTNTMSEGQKFFRLISN